ncbi:MAG: DNA cytosine methyltransferase [Planctomycetota bacterium]
MLVLSLFPGIGLLDHAFELEGFCVVRGPDLLWGGDIKRFHPPAGVFDGVIGGPPCQRFSRLVHLARARGANVAPNLIPEFERCVREALPGWFLMENVPDAPEPAIDYYLIRSQAINNRWLGESQNRLRRFSWGWHLDGQGRPPPELRIEGYVALESPEYARAITCDAREIPVAIGGSGKRKSGVTGGTLPRSGRQLSIAEMLRLQGYAPDLLDGCPLTVTGKREVIGNGVPLPMGRAVARAVKRALQGMEGRG